MRKPEAVIFDMDGVLIDSEPIHIKIENKLFAELGINVTEAVHRSYMGASNEYMYSDLRLRFNLKESVGELMERDDLFRSDYFSRLETIPLNDGLISLLEEMKSTGLKLAVATSSSPDIVNILLNKCEIASFFEAVVTTSEAGKSKPYPDVYLLAAQKIGVSPQNCIVFEDSPNGLLSAQSAGMLCVAIQSDYKIIQELSKADYLIQSFNEITVSKLIEIFSFNKIPN
ncbi:MAG TPA: HAD family phosphatase [Prolixibacteraceae bacterium]|jgi:HAD superfamily hydrolase (TIGR01509 family)